MMRRLLVSVHADRGIYPEVTRRLLVIRDRLDKLHQLFDGGHEPLGMAKEEWNRRLEYAVIKFRQSVEQIKTMLKGEENFTVTKLLTHLRRLAIRLYKVELAMQEEIEVALDLVNDNGGRTLTGSLPAVSPVAVDELGPAQVASSPVAELSFEAPGADGKPRASAASGITGISQNPIVMGGAVYAGDLSPATSALSSANDNLYGATELIVDGNTIRKVAVDTAE